MPSARPLALASLAVVVLVVAPWGFGPGGALRPGEPARDAPVQGWTTVVHGADGVLLPDEAFPGELPRFEQHMVVQPMGAWEPTVAAMRDGHLAFIGMTSVRTDVYTSADEGRTWLRAVQHPVPTLLDGSGLIADPFVYADPATDRLYSANLHNGDGCTLLQWSDDHGASWDWSIIGECLGDVHAHDHQSIVTSTPRVTQTDGYPSLVHYCASDFYTAAFCSVSKDGGRTFSPRADSGLHACSGTTGHLAAAPDGTVYLPQLSCGRGEVLVSISRDDGATWTPMLVERHATHADHDAEIAVDDAGNVYYLYYDDHQLPRLSISRDAGLTWSPSIGVAAPGLTGCKHPSIVAGEEGRIAFLCIGTMAPGGFGMTGEATRTAEWKAYVTMSLDALADEPVFVTTTAHAPEDPVARGGPGELYYLGDFLKIATAPDTGRVYVAFVDACTVACFDANTPRQAVWYPGAVGAQVEGATLRDAPRPAPSVPATAAVEPSSLLGDVLARL